MGRTIITAIVAIVIIWGIYYLVTNRTKLGNPTTNTNVEVTATGTNAGTSTGTSSPSVATTSKNVAIEIRNFAYSPANITVQKGTKITWTNRDTAPHTVTSVTGTVLDSPTLSTGQSFSYTFNATGTFNYYCTIHPNMKASVTVTE